MSKFIDLTGKKFGATLSWRINNNWKEEELKLPVNLSNRVIRKEKKYESV